MTEITTSPMLGGEDDAVAFINGHCSPTGSWRERLGGHAHKHSADWADAYRRMPQGSVLDRWRTAKVPMLRELAEAMASRDPGKKFIGIAKSSQIGVSETLLNDMLWHFDERPESMLAYMPTEPMMKTWRLTRLDRSLRQPPFIGRGLHNVRNEYYLNGASLLCFGAGSSNTMSAVTAKRIYADELARFKEDIGGEGDFLSLVANRAATYGEDAKIIVASTPIDETRGEGTFWSFHQRGDCRVWMIPCPGCGGAWEWDVEQLVTRDEEVLLLCPLPTSDEEGAPMCGHVIRDGDERDAAVATGRWEATKEADFGYVSYHVNGLHAPSDWRPFRELRDEFIACRDGKASRKAFYNTKLGKFYKDEDARRPPPSIVERRMTARRQLKMGVVPDFASVLLLAVDVQKDRLVYEVSAIGPQMEIHSVEVGEPEANIRDIEGTAKIIRDLYDRSFVRQDGRLMRIYAGVMDEGFEAACVHQITDQFSPCVYHKNIADIPQGALQPVRGGDADVVTRPILSVPGGPTASGRPNNNKFVRIGSPMLKFRIYRTLEHDPEECPAWWMGASVDHPPEYFEQLVAEDIVFQYHKLTRKKTLMFRKPHESVKNDYLDCKVYTMGLMHLMQVERWSDDEWAARRDAECIAPEEGLRLAETTKADRERADEEDAQYQKELREMEQDGDW